MRDEELGKIQTPFTKYEKKLMLAGFFAGHTLGERKSNPLAMLESIIGGAIIKVERERRKEEEDGEEG